MLDLILRKGILVDGTGKPAVRADVGVKGGFIDCVGDLEGVQASLVLDVHDQIVAPGFIDFHSHSDLHLLIHPDACEKVSQGVTTEVIGNCGFSAFPVAEARQELLQTYVVPTLGNWEPEHRWHDASGYLALLEQTKPAVNVVTLVGHGSLRISVMGFERRPPTQEEMELMVSLLRRDLDDGAAGLTSGLIYAPGYYAGFGELARLCEAVASRGKLYASHVKSESDQVVESVEDLIRLSAVSGCRVHLSHHKISGKRNWGKSEDTLASMRAGRAQGYQISCDQYPYLAGSSTATVLIPPWATEGGIKAMLERLKSEEVRDRIRADYKDGVPHWECLVKDNGWENIILNWAASDDDSRLVGHSFAEIGEMIGCEPATYLFDLLLRNSGKASIVVFQQSEGDMRRIMRDEWTVFGSDAIHAADRRPHPRLWGTFPRILGRYVRVEGVLRLEDAIHRMTGKSASLLGLSKMGQVKKGYHADLVVFDAERIEDRATFENPCERSVGISHVIVSGRPVMLHGERTRERPGRVIRV